jgi:hypothetical protein
MGRIGLEWSFRLLSDPKRFWFRYLVEPWVVAGAMLRHMSLRPPSELPIAIDSAMMGPITATPEPGLAGAVAADTLVTPVSG